MITSKDLEKICNYVESTKPSLPKAMISYIDYVEEPNDEYKRYLKSRNRNLAIDALLDDKVEEYKSREFGGPLDNESYITTISPKITSINVQGKTYLGLEDIYTDIMMTLESITSKVMTTSQNLNVVYQNDPKLTDYENVSAKSRRVLTRISLISNLIATTGRTGSNTIIAGLDVYKYLMISNVMMMNTDGIVTGDIMGMNVIPSPYIKSNKIIMMRNVQKTENGLNVINCPNDMRYFLKETPKFDKIINWFEVI